MKAIMAVNKAGYIGLGSGLPWSCPADLRHFKALTMGKRLLVGRVTYESMPILKGRELVVVGQGYNSLETALKLMPDYVIGGKAIYESTLHLCSELHISIIEDYTVGDVKAPDLSQFKGKVVEYFFE